MSRLLVLALMITSCSWSNALYRARQLSERAERAERQERGFDANALWGQAAVKAESAYAHQSTGQAGAEALWLRGRALARLSDCKQALPLLAQSVGQAEGADWAARVRLDLARCRVAAGDPVAALADLNELRQSSDQEIREEARVLAGRALVATGRWEDALSELASDETIGGRWQRAVAAANLGRTAQVIELVTPRIERADTGADWASLIRLLGHASETAADSLLARLDSMRSATDTLRSRWRYAAADGLFATDSAAANRRLRRLLTEPAATREVKSLARGSLAIQQIRAISDSASLALAMAEAGELGRGDPRTTLILRPLLRAGERIMTEITEHPAGTRFGDMIFYSEAAVARDTLLAPALSDWLLAEIEARWPESPYLVKAMLARIAHNPDSAAAIRQRVLLHGDSPYLRYLAGKEGPRFAALEDSLDRYLLSRREAPSEADKTSDKVTDF